MDLSIPDDKYDALTKRALAAGFTDLSGFLDALLGEPAEDPRGVLNEEQLRESAADCERGVAELKAGGGREFREALLEIGRKRGYPTPE